MRFFTATAFTIITAALGLAAGCQSSSNSAKTADPGHDVALSCAKCQTTYHKSTSTNPGFKGGPTVTSTRTTSEHECAECRNVAKDYIRFGKLQLPGTIVHSCKTCGGELKVCHTEEL